MKSNSELKKIATEVRLKVLEMVYKAKSGHLAGALGMADIISVLYYNVLNHNSLKPSWNGRDRVVLSNGHICPVLYTILAKTGYFPESELLTLRKIDSKLQGHPHNLDVPGIENSSGPLGLGVATAVGFALAAKIKKQNHKIYCLSGDGEHDEGMVWEAYLLASKYKLDNLVFIIDRNNIQLDGITEDILSLEPFKKKLESFNLQVIEIDGHDFTQINSALNETNQNFERPTAIIAYTIPGKGVSFMQDNYEWHGKAPNEDEFRRAKKELKNESD